MVIKEGMITSDLHDSGLLVSQHHCCITKYKNVGTMGEQEEKHGSKKIWIPRRRPITFEASIRRFCIFGTTPNIVILATLPLVEDDRYPKVKRISN